MTDKSVQSMKKQQTITLIRILAVIIAAFVCLAGCDQHRAVDPLANPPAEQPAVSPSEITVSGTGSSMDNYPSIYHPAHIGSGEAWNKMQSDAGAVMLDVRSEGSYVERHVSIAVNVPYENLSDYAAANLPNKDVTIICYCFCDDKGGPALAAYNLLTEMGYTKVFYTEPGDEWTYEGTSVSESEREENMISYGSIITGQQAKDIRDADASVVILDVRNQDEYDAGHIDGAILIPVAELENRLKDLPSTETVIIVHCRSGRRSANAMEILRAHGYTKIYDMQAATNWPDPLVR